MYTVLCTPYSVQRAGHKAERLRTEGEKGHRAQRVPQWGATQEHGQLDAMQMDPIRGHLFGPISGPSTGSAVSHLNGWDNMGAAKMADDDRHSAELEFSPLVDSLIWS